jgi:hypothetical protein
LKVVYHGPKAMEELVAYDPHLVVGILGGGAGTTYDAFKLIAEAQKYGARVALFGRKINQAENQLAFVEFLRLIVERVISPEEAVRAYHAVLAKLAIKPQRTLDDDLVLQTAVMSYGGGSTVAVPANVPKSAKSSSNGVANAAPAKTKAGDCGCGCGGHKSPELKPAPCGCSHKSVAASAAAGQVTPVEAPQSLGGTPDFAHMTQAEKLAYNQRERNRVFG